MITPAASISVDAADAESTLTSPVEVVAVAIAVPHVPVPGAPVDETTTGEEHADQAAPTPAVAAAETAEPDVSIPDDHSSKGETEDSSSPPPTTADDEPLPPPVSEADLARAVELLDESIAERTEAYYVQQIERVKGIQGEVKLLRALIARELVTRRAASHG